MDVGELGEHLGNAKHSGTPQKTFKSEAEKGHTTHIKEASLIDAERQETLTQGEAVNCEKTLVLRSPLRACLLLREHNMSAVGWTSDHFDSRPVGSHACGASTARCKAADEEVLW